MIEISVEVRALKSNRYTPSCIGTDSEWSAVACGEQYTLALKTNGSLWAWGCGYGTNPSLIGSDTDWSMISAGSGVSRAIKTNGTLWTWGNGQPPTLVGE